jgi:hypothetical protein
MKEMTIKLIGNNVMALAVLLCGIMCGVMLSIDFFYGCLVTVFTSIGLAAVISFHTMRNRI